MLLDKRFDTKTAATLLQTLMEALTPGTLRPKEVVQGIHNWETKIAILKTRYDEELRPMVKLAVLMSILPKDFQEMVLQNGQMQQRITFEGARDYVLHVATQRNQMAQPRPFDVYLMGVGGGERDDPNYAAEGSDDWGVYW